MVGALSRIGIGSGSREDLDGLAFFDRTSHQGVPRTRETNK